MKFPRAAALLFLGSAILSHAEITLKVADAEAAAGGEVQVPIMISGSQNVGPLQFMVDYDPRLLEAMADPPGEEAKGVIFGKVVKGGMVAQNATTIGEWRLAMRTDEPITQDGELLRLRFKVKGKAGDSSTLMLQAAEAWEKESLFEVRVRTQPGTVTVTGGGLSRWLWWVGAVILLLLLGGALFVFLRRKKEGPSEKIAPAPMAAPPVPATAAAPATPLPAASSSDDEVMNKLKKLKDMQAAGLISAEDFEKKKNELLGRI